MSDGASADNDESEVDDPTLGGFIVSDAHNSDSAASDFDEKSDAEIEQPVVDDNPNQVSADSEPDASEELGSDNASNGELLLSFVCSILILVRADDNEETEDSVMHSGFQDPLERQMNLYKSLPFLRHDFWCLCEAVHSVLQDCRVGPSS